MYKVMLVEDEILVRVGLKSMIQWNDFNMEVVADEENGQAALDSFRNLRPEIVITDIVMPMMNGTQLISEIRKIDDNKTQIIVLTCLEDFKTVHAALTMGVSDYIVKLTMTEEELEQKLQKVKDELDHIPKHVATKYADNGHLTHRDFIKNQIRYGLYSNEEFSHKINELAPEIKSAKLIICSFEIDRVDEALNKYGHLLKNAVINVLDETLSEFRNAIVVDDNEFRFIMLASFHNVVSEHNRNQLLNNILQQIRHNLMSYLKLSVSVGISQYGDSFTNLKKMHEESKTALQAKFFSKIGEAHHCKDTAS
ncbi:MAG: response regulator, partial [Paenibacillaceae bacterium]|nr:response regulator [Paenibacillaceae bacterium]